MLTPATITDALAPYGITPSEEMAHAIGAYVEILLQWNEKVSLTSLTGPREILERHFGESFFAARAVPIAGGRLADVGSGAGFPGLALKIQVPRLDVTLLEPNLKKATFLGEVVRRLELENVRIERRRFEELPASPSGFDYITARALGQVETFLSWAANSLAPKGRVVLWLGPDMAEAARRNEAWSWREALLIPQSKKRLLLIGQLKSQA